MRKKTTEEFIAESISIYGEGAFDYSKADYNGGHKPITLICKNGHEIHPLPSNHLRGFGCHICAHESQKRNAYGNGINDMINTRNMPFEKCWRHMMERCYNPKILDKFPTYKGCTVCPEWHYLSNFKRWFEDPANGYREGYHLDKDILVKGNKVYSPDTCCFVPKEINILIKTMPKGKKGLPKGVTFKGKSYVAVVEIGGVRYRSERFSTPEAAFLAYKKAKEQYVKELAEKYYKEDKITERVYRALLDYRVDITD